MNCPLCNEPIADNQSRVCVYMPHGGVRYCHRMCAAEKWPDLFENRPNPRLVG